MAAMDDPRWLRMITIGLVLTALAVGYFLFTGGFKSNRTQKTSEVMQVSPTPTQIPFATIAPSQTAIPSAYQQISQRAQGGVQNLPNTGFPVGLAVVFSISAIISGFSLRKFPQ